MNEMLLSAYTSQKEPKGINETHLFARNLSSQRREVGAGDMDATCVSRLDASRSDQLGHEVKTEQLDRLFTLSERIYN